ncbi:hypothetical protein IW261DRAFT_1359113, partial [Armillaria novae-zelandiae]
MLVCKEKPDSLPALDAINLEPPNQIDYPMSRGGSSRHCQGSGAMPPLRQNPANLEFNPGSSFGKEGSTRARSFVPRQRSSARVSIKTPEGKEIDLETLKNRKHSPALSGTALPPVVSPAQGSLNRRYVIRMEPEEELEKELAKAKAKADSKAKKKAKKEKEENQRREEEKEKKEKEGRECTEKEGLEGLENSATSKDQEKEKDLRINTTSPRRRPGPFDLSTTKANIPPPVPSALATARIIDDLGRVPYPEGIKSPRIELNINAKDGKF